MPPTLLKVLRRAHRFERSIAAMYDVVIQGAPLMTSEKQALLRCQQDHLSRVAWLDRQLSRAGHIVRQKPPRCWATRLAVWWDRSAAFWLLDELESRGRRSYESICRKLSTEETIIVERSLLRRQRYTEAGCWHATHASELGAVSWPPGAKAHVRHH